MGTRKCIFCDGSPLTKEHIWPQWLIEHAERFVTFTTTQVRDGRRDISRKWNSPVVEVRRVCAECNNGWMSKLEGRAQEFIKPMSCGHPKRLDRKSSRILAAWSVKSAMLWETQVEPSRRLFVDGDLKHLRLTGNPPDQTIVQLASSDTTRFEMTSFLRAPEAMRLDGVPVNVYSVKLLIGRLVLHVFGIRAGPDSGVATCPPVPYLEDNPALRTLWPWRAGRDFVPWPPPKSIFGPAELRKIALQFR